MRAITFFIIIIYQYFSLMKCCDVSEFQSKAQTKICRFDSEDKLKVEKISKEEGAGESGRRKVRQRERENIEEERRRERTVCHVGCPPSSSSSSSSGV